MYVFYCLRHTLQLNTIQPNKPVVTDSYVESPCWNCGNTKSIQMTYSIKKCQENKVKYESQQSLWKNQLAAHKFFTSQISNVSPTITTLKLILSTTISKLEKDSVTSTICTYCHFPHPGLQCVLKPLYRLLAEFHSKINKLPQEVSEADDDHPLACFSGNPVKSASKAKQANLE